MLQVLLQMAGLILCGVAWQVLRPANLGADQTRVVLTTLVYYLMLPALVLTVLWDAPLGIRSLVIAGSAASGVLAGTALGWATCRLCRRSRAQTGALILAVAFPNATYMGLPVLEALYGPGARSIAVQYDLFACTPLLFTLGILVASHYGRAGGAERSMRQHLWRIPALWAAFTAIGLNLSGLPQPELVRGLLGLLERGVVPLMLLAIGLSLQWERSRWHLLPSLLPVLILKLLAVPALVLGVTWVLGAGGDLRAGLVMEAAMPTMVLGLVLCDRFRLDVGLYAAAVTLTTATSLATLPLWFGWMGG